MASEFLEHSLQEGEPAPGRAPALDRSGRLIVFASRHPTGPEDREHDEDLFVRSFDRPPNP